MPNLDFDAFSRLAKDYNLIPLYEELPADLDTPVTVFLKLRSGEYGFLFESVVGGETWARYSFVGTSPRRVYFIEDGQLRSYEPETDASTAPPHSGNPLHFFRGLMAKVKPWQDRGLPRFFGGYVGYLAYDMVRHFEGVRTGREGPYPAPELCFLDTDEVVIFDNLAQVMKIVRSVRVPDASSGDKKALRRLYDEAASSIRLVRARLLDPLPAPPMDPLGPMGEPMEALSRSEYMELVRRAREYIAAGDIFQVVLSNRFEIRAEGVDPFAVYRRLRRINPSPYMYFLRLGPLAIAGASPEILVRLDEGKVTVRPIAGTRPRGRTEAEDRDFERELKADPKEIAEHVMLVDLGRNDVGRVAGIGSVAVAEQKVVERYSHVMHLVSHVAGDLAPGKDVFDVIAAAFPAGTLTGAPKIRAMEIIGELERSARRVYGGAVGYVSYTGNTDLAIAIRTAVFSGGRAFIQAGAGIVHDSVPEREYEECVNKANGIICALRGA